MVMLCSGPFAGCDDRANLSYGTCCFRTCCLQLELENRVWLNIWKGITNVRMIYL